MKRKGFIRRTNDAAKLQSSLRTLQEQGVDILDIIISDDYQSAVSSLSDGDVLIVRTLTDICSGIRGLMNLIQQISARKATLLSVEDTWFDITATSFSWVTFAGEMLVLDRKLRSVNTTEALSALKANGVKLGRPRGSVSIKGEERLNKCLEPYLHSSLSVVKICKTNNVNLRTFYRFLEKHQISKRRQQEA